MRRTTSSWRRYNRAVPAQAARYHSRVQLGQQQVQPVEQQGKEDGSSPALAQ